MTRRVVGLLGAGLLASLGILTFPAIAPAGPAAIVSSGAGDTASPATHVAVMREGSSTVMSISATFAAGEDEIALVVPVDGDVGADTVQTLPSGLFDTLDRLTAPRLIEVWERDPCSDPPPSPAPPAPKPPPPESVEASAKLAVGQYDVAMLGVPSSRGVSKWLTDEGYRVSESAQAALDGYAEDGLRFVVAKLRRDAAGPSAKPGALPAIRLHYSAKELRVPLRFGLSGDDTTHDTIVYALGRGTRFVPEGLPHAFIPTNVDVGETQREGFRDFYGTLLETMHQKTAGVVVTEYAFGANVCDPCPTNPLGAEDLATLGADVLFATEQASDERTLAGRVTIGEYEAPDSVVSSLRSLQPRFESCLTNALKKSSSEQNGTVTIEISINRKGDVTRTRHRGGDALDQRMLGCMKNAIDLHRFSPVSPEQAIEVPLELETVPAVPPVVVPTDFVLTRLHVRTGKDSPSHLTLVPAEPIAGGTGAPGAEATAQGATPADANAFQARYLLKHPWGGSVACDSPVRGVFGGPGGAQELAAPRIAQDIANAKRDGDLAAMAAGRIEALGVDGRAATSPVLPPATAAPSSSAAPVAPPPAGSEGCSGCRVAAGSETSGRLVLLAGLLSLGALARRRRRY